MGGEREEEEGKLVTLHYMGLGSIATPKIPSQTAIEA